MMDYAHLLQVGPSTFVDPSKVTVIDADEDGDLYLLGKFGDNSGDEYANYLYLPEWNAGAERLFLYLTGKISGGKYWVSSDEPNPDADKHSAFDEE